MEKTLGGDRLGAGNKMKVHLHNYERSTHDLGHLWRSTLSAGTLVPFLKMVALPGDTFDIKLNCDVKTHPTIGPLFGSYKVQLDLFVAPLRLYNSMLHNNTLKVGLNMSQVKLPQIEMTALAQALPEDGTNIDNTQVNPSSLLAYLGIRGIGWTSLVTGDETRQFNAVPIIAYWDIYKNYYANKQEDIGSVIHTPSAEIIETVDTMWVDTSGNTFPESPSIGSRAITEGSIIGLTYTGAEPDPTQIIIKTNAGDYTAAQLTNNTLAFASSGVMSGFYDANTFGDLHILNWRYMSATDSRTGKPEIATFPLENIDEMRRAILALWNVSTPLVINDVDLEPYKWLYEQPDGFPNALSSQEGLGLKTYQSDLFNNWLKTENIDAITSQTAISTAGASFTIDQLNLSRKVYNLLNRINVSGGSYDDWIDAAYAHEGHRRTEMPAYVGGLIKELVFQEVVSNTESADQPLGTLAGKGVMGNKHKGGYVVIKVDEPAYVIGIISLTPRIDYSQGNDWDINLKTIDDLHKPALDEIGFQDLVTEQMAWWDTVHNNVTWVQRSAGKQPAWINYMTAVNKVYGNFADVENEMFMTLNRRYEWGAENSGITDLTTYIDPSKFNFIFAETQLDAQNFWVQIAMDIEARRKMSAKIMPNL